jgi:hypothetical protein
VIRIVNLLETAHRFAFLRAYEERKTEISLGDDEYPTARIDRAKGRSKCEILAVAGKKS